MQKILLGVIRNNKKEIVYLNADYVFDPRSGKPLSGIMARLAAIEEKLGMVSGGNMAPEGYDLNGATVAPIVIVQNGVAVPENAALAIEVEEVEIKTTGGETTGDEAETPQP